MSYAPVCAARYVFDGCLCFWTTCVGPVLHLALQYSANVWYRMTVLEAAAEKLQAALLASLEDEKPTGAQQQQDKSKRKKDKKGRRAKKALAGAEPARPADSYAQPLSPGYEAAVASQRGTAEQQDCAAPILNGTQSAQDSDTASADTGAEQIHSSSGEGERTSEIALGLAGETTSEDEWKARALLQDSLDAGT